VEEGGREGASSYLGRNPANFPPPLSTKSGRDNLRQVSWLPDLCSLPLPDFRQWLWQLAPQLQWRDRAGFSPDFPIKVKPPETIPRKIIAQTPGKKNFLSNFYVLSYGILQIFSWL